MSTRANIIVTDGHDTMIFYRHSDGYPEGTLPTLFKYMDWVKGGKVRDNTLQSVGWLIVIGHTEDGYESKIDKDGPSYWKVGAYEPTVEIHGDIEYLYLVDLSSKTIKCINGDIPETIAHALKEFDKQTAVKLPKKK